MRAGMHPASVWWWGGGAGLVPALATRSGALAALSQTAALMRTSTKPPDARFVIDTCCFQISGGRGNVSASSSAVANKSR